MKKAFLLLICIVPSLISTKWYPFKRTKHHSEEHHHKHHHKNTQFIEITNHLSKPIVINFIVQREAQIGYYGYLVHPKAQQELDLHEFGWFSKVAAGGFDKVREEKTMDILNHAFADTAEIIIPGEQMRTVKLKKDHNEIVID